METKHFAGVHAARFIANILKQAWRHQQKSDSLSNLKYKQCFELISSKSKNIAVCCVLCADNETNELLLYLFFFNWNEVIDYWWKKWEK